MAFKPANQETGRERSSIRGIGPAPIQFKRTKEEVV